MTTPEPVAARPDDEISQLRSRLNEHMAARVNAEVDRDGLIADVARKEELRVRANARADKAEAELASQRATIERLERALAKHQKVCDLLMNATFITNHPEHGDISFNFWTHAKICEFIEAMAALSADEPNG